jgi:hypothetical protein
MNSGDPTSVEELLAEARAQLIRVAPGEALRKIRDGAVLVDIRSESQRRDDGLIPGFAIHSAKCPRVALGPRLS